MKTQIIQLNRNDDYLSVRDQMSWSQTGRILLVWPDQGHVLNRQLDLNLAKRHASTMGAQLALVTHDSEVRFYAQQVGIPVFKSLRRAQDTIWRVDSSGKIGLQRNSQHPDLVTMRKNIQLKTPTRMEHHALRFLFFGLSVIALFALGIFILPGAKIMLSPQVEEQSMVFDLSSDPASTSINLSTGSLPTYSLVVVVEGRDTITPTGSVVIPGEPAICSLRFTNGSNQKITIPARTIVTTLGSDPVRFITSSINDLTVNPGLSVVLNARAIIPGPSGNLPPNQLVAIENDLGPDLMVTNPYPTYGGSDATVPSPTTQDLQSLRDHLLITLKQNALLEMQSILPEEDKLILPTLAIIETLAETNFPVVGEPGIELELSMRLRVQSQVVSAKTLHSLVIPIMDSNTPTGYSALVNTLEITQLSKPTLEEDGKTHWTIRAARKLQVDIPKYLALDIIKGSTVAQAVERLSASLPLSEQAQISLSPAWWPRLPFLTMRMEVIQSEIR